MDTGQETDPTVRKFSEKSGQDATGTHAKHIFVTYLHKGL